MQFKLINNFSQKLTASLGGDEQADVTLSLDENAGEMSDASPDVVYPLTLFETDSQGAPTGVMEIVYVTGYDSGSGDLTVTRARENTTAVTWAPNTPVEVRATSEMLMSGKVHWQGQARKGVLEADENGDVKPFEPTLEGLDVGKAILSMGEVDYVPDAAITPHIGTLAYSRQLYFSHDKTMALAAMELDADTDTAGYVLDTGGAGVLLDLGAQASQGNTNSNMLHYAVFSDDDTTLTIMFSKWQATSGSSFAGRIVQYNTADWTVNFDVNMESQTTLSANSQIAGMKFLADGRILIGLRDALLTDGTTDAFVGILDTSTSEVTPFTWTGDLVAGNYVKYLAIDEARSKLIVSAQWAPTAGGVFVLDYDSLGGTLTKDPNVDFTTLPGKMPESGGEILLRGDYAYIAAFEGWDNAHAIVRVNLDTGAVDGTTPGDTPYELRTGMGPSYRGKLLVDESKAHVYVVMYEGFATYDLDTLEKVIAWDADAVGGNVQDAALRDSGIFHYLPYTREGVEIAEAKLVDELRLGLYYLELKKKLSVGATNVRIGVGSEVDDDRAVAIGDGAVAGQTSVAVGGVSKADAYGAVAYGYQAEATGLYSAAFGRLTAAEGQSAFAGGDGARAIGERSVCISDANAYADDSVAIGDGSQTGTTSGDAVSCVAVGHDAEATGTLAVAIGDGASASADRTTVVGYNASATGETSVAYGRDATATGEFSAALGPSTTVAGNSTTVIGYNATGDGDFSAAMGYEASVPGDRSLAVGYKSNAVGGWALAAGWEATAYGNSSVALGYQAVTGTDTGDPSVDGFGAVAIGRGVISEPGNAVAVGNGATVTLDGSVAIGESADAEGSYAMAIGKSASAKGSWATAVGPGAVSLRDEAVGLGSAWSVAGTFAVAVGSNVFAGDYDENTTVGDRAVVVGTTSFVKGVLSLAVGAYAYTAVSAPYSTVIGAGAYSEVEAGVRINGVPFLPATPEGMGTDTEMGYDVQPTLYDNQPAIARRTSSQVVVETDALDLTTVNDVQELTLPTGLMMFVDSIEVVVVGSDTPGGTPEIQVGTDAGTPADLLAATTVGKTAVGGREKHTPLIDDGVTAIRAEVTTAGTGTAYQARVIVKGYVMEL